MKETSGVALLSSSGFDQRSTAKSPDDELSLFTHYLVRALEGDPDALDENRHLTIFSLHSFLFSFEPASGEQTPNWALRKGSPSRA